MVLFVVLPVLNKNYSQNTTIDGVYFTMKYMSYTHILLVLSEDNQPPTDEDKLITPSQLPYSNGYRILTSDLRFNPIIRPPCC